MSDQPQCTCGGQHGWIVVDPATGKRLTQMEVWEMHSEMKRLRKKNRNLRRDVMRLLKRLRPTSGTDDRLTQGGEDAVTGG